MGLEYYDSCPWPEESKQHRLAPAVSLSKAGIPCVVWAEDALAFIHLVPTGLSSLQLLIPDELIHKATSILTTQSFQVADTPQEWLEYPMWDRSTPSCHPGIWLHPQSLFSVDVRDHSLSITLDKFPDTVRFLTRAAFLDTIFALILEPPIGFNHHRFHSTMMCYYSGLIQHTMRGPSRLPSGELGEAHKAALAEVREENYPYFHNLLSGGQMAWTEAVAQRREVMGKIRKGHEVDRPFPRNTAAVEERNAKIAAAAAMQPVSNAT
ncbi:unnamed protein product [Cyclocybe aegerita]|uniref:Uncharacterized protein n=1 Tax=Cyclocybe aegerita TaxID=1973307 RepID=A0A8S0VQC2_CYCAE|nr:unnamed protein product [Cyclocybe aegerita]